ncbi:MAG: PBP1A family penicillin-binding protein [Candidatus Pacebacteria bacterium]|jgi:1A family penicillin-binding protein|nr:PBP1A family penicillin-binding protein [Candidatus Paceibacterota bacterium]
MRKKKIISRKIRNIGLSILGLGAIAVGVLFIWIGTAKIPDFRSLNDRKILNSTKIYDRTGETLLYDLHDDVKRTIIPLESMGENIKNATISIEDREFYNHHGIRPTSIIRAVFSTIFKGDSQGGSTITQQVIKNSLLTQEKSVTRKFKEWILSIKVDRTLGKDEILALYLNENPYGGAIYGVQEASQSYFKKNPADLTVAEAAYLAAIPQSPTQYSPYGKNLDRLENRKNQVLKNMFDQGYLSQEEYTAAKAEVVVFQPKEQVGIKAPHFVFYVRDYLMNKYGEDTVYTGGLKVITTLDWSLQEKGEKIVKEWAEKNEKTAKASNAGLVAVDPKTGQILTMVGSRDYFGKALPEGCISGKDCKFDPNFNSATSPRQPGSSFKPFAYATAFEKGFLPETVLFDVPTEFSNSCSGNSASCYNPDNFDNLFKGPISMRSALAESRNVPAVKTLYLAGLDETLKTAKDMGIHSLGEAKTYGLTLVLGGGEVSLLDMTSAYGVFANEGVRMQPTPVLTVTDKDGKIIEEYKEESVQVIPKNVALQISDVLSDNNARIPTFGANSPLYFAGRDVAAKTGTTNDNRDAWVMGYTPTIAVGAWSGNSDNSKMTKGGSAVSGPLWHAFMAEALKTMPNEQFEEPNQPENYSSLKPVLRGQWQGGQSYFIDTVSGGLATEFTPDETKKEVVTTGVHDILYWVNKNDPTGPVPTNPSSDPQFHLWEAPVLKWAAEHPGLIPNTGNIPPPTYYDNVHTSQNSIGVSILTPNTNTTYDANAALTVLVSVSSPNQIKKVDYFINETYIGTSDNSPFSFTVTPSSVASISSLNELKAIATDSIFNKKEATVSFTVSGL